MPITNIEPVEKPKMPEEPPKKKVNIVVVIIIPVVIILIGAGVFWFLKKTEPQYGSLDQENANQSTNLSVDDNAIDETNNASSVAGYSNFKSTDYHFSTIYKTKWIAKQYAEQDLGNGDISKIIAFYSFDDYQNISAGKAPDYQGSIFIEIHKPIWQSYQDVKSGKIAKVVSYTLDNQVGYHDTTNNIIYVEFGDYVYSIALRGSQNTDVFDNMLKYFKFI